MNHVGCLCLLVISATIVPPCQAGGFEISGYKHALKSIAHGQIQTPGEEKRIALEAARLDLEINRGIVEEQRAIGALTGTEYRQQIDDYRLGIGSYRNLIEPSSSSTGDVETLVANRDRLLELSAGGVGDQAPSLLSEADIKVGNGGQVLVDKSSLKQVVDSRLSEMRSALGDDSDAGPALAYLQELQDSSDRRLGTVGHGSKTLPIAQVGSITAPVQRYQATLAGGARKIQLHLTTRPAAAIVVLTAIRLREELTSNTNRVLTRGILKYRVSKAGFKTIEAEMNLVSARGEFSCILVPENHRQAALPCNIE